MKKIKDGIVDLEKYNQAKYKVLWILKEGNVDEQDKEDDRDICDEFRKNQHKENACAIPTFRKVIYASFGILYPEICWRDIPSANSDGYEIIKEIAYINLNKYPGDSVSDWNTIKNAYNENRIEILGQIETYNPNIIICGGTGDYIPWCDLEPIGWGNEKTEKLNGEMINGKVFTNYYLVSSERLLICLPHPAYRGIGDEDYWAQIKNAVLHWERLR